MAFDRPVQFLHVGSLQSLDDLVMFSSVGRRKGDAELKTKFDDAIAAARAGGMIRKLSEKWFGFDLMPQ